MQLTGSPARIHPLSGWKPRRRVSASTTPWAGRPSPTFDVTGNRNVEKIGVPCIIAYGTIDEVFPSRAWAFQFGLSWPDAALSSSRSGSSASRSPARAGWSSRLGEALCLRPRRANGGRRTPRDGTFDYGSVWRSYRWYDEYEPAQAASLIALINKLLRRPPTSRERFRWVLHYGGQTLLLFPGRSSGTRWCARTRDIPARPGSFWDKVVAGCGLEAVAARGDIPPPAGPVYHLVRDRCALRGQRPGDPEDERSPAGSMVKGTDPGAVPGRPRHLHQAADNRNPNGSTALDDFKQGDQSLPGAHRPGAGWGVSPTRSRYRPSMKKIQTTCVSFVILLVAFTYISARFVDRGKIAQLPTEQARRSPQRDSILAYAGVRGTRCSSS